MLGLVNRPNDISISRGNQSQAKFKSDVGRNLLQSWVNLTIVTSIYISTSSATKIQLLYTILNTITCHNNY